MTQSAKTDFSRSAKDISPEDLHIGKMIRKYRKARKMTLAALGREVGVSFQQIQKYETGKNKAYAVKLKDIANALGVPVGDFFSDNLDLPLNVGLDTDLRSLAKVWPEISEESKNIIMLVGDVSANFSESKILEPQ